jgi:hypothetical protein
MSYSFKKGFRLIPHGEAKEVKRELMGALGIKTNVGFRGRIRGDVEPKVSEAEKIEEVFSRHGVPKSKVWGE